jgi:hypothetical protein
VLSGRVAVKITQENGIIKAGDRLTVSTTTAGFATKLLGEGYSIGIALSDDDGRGKIMMLNNLSYQRLDMAGNYASTTNMLTTGNLDLNANAVAINNIKSISSANGTWSIDENGKIKANILCLEDVCINKTQLQQILTNNGISNATSTDTTSQSVPTVLGTSTSTENNGSSTSSITTNSTTTDNATTTPPATSTSTDITIIPPTDTTNSTDTNATSSP